MIWDFRIKEQEDLLKKNKGEVKVSHPIDDDISNDRRKEMEELVIIEQFLREQEEDEKMKINQSVLNEDLIQDAQSNSVYAGNCFNL